MMELEESVGVALRSVTCTIASFQASAGDTKYIAFMLKKNTGNRPADGDTDRFGRKSCHNQIISRSFLPGRSGK